MTESLPHLNTLMKIFEEIFGVQIWKTLYIALKFKNPKNCPKHWGMITLPDAEVHSSGNRNKQY